MSGFSLPAQPGQPAQDPMRQAAYSFKNRLMRLLWGVSYALLFRTSPKPLFAWRTFLLRVFGAKIHPTCKFYPKCRVWAPWNLICEDMVAIADDAELYNPSPFHFGSHAIVSQGAYVCGATHLYNDNAFPLVSYPMRFGRYSWVCARAMVSPGVNMGDGSILALGAVATKDLEPFGVYAGVPARRIKSRDPNAVPAA